MPDFRETRREFVAWHYVDNGHVLRRTDTRCVVIQATPRIILQAEQCDHIGNIITLKIIHVTRPLKIIRTKAVEITNGPSVVERQQERAIKIIELMN